MSIIRQDPKSKASRKVSITSFIGTTILLIFSSLPKEQFLSWGWRIPFLLSCFVVFVGFYLRLKVMDSQVFVKAMKHKRPPKVPALEMGFSSFSSK